MTNNKVYAQNVRGILRDIIIGIVIYIMCDYFQYIEQLNKFFTEQALIVMGVILPINISGIGQAHLSMNNIEERKGVEIPAFAPIRLDFKITLHMLVLCFLICIASWCVLNKHTQNLQGIDIFDISIIAYIVSFVIFMQCLYETYYKGILEIPSVINNSITDPKHQ